MTAATTEKLGCDTSDMLTIHALFRRAFTDAPGLVSGVEDGDLARLAPVAGHVREVAGALHHHHQGEDQLLWTRSSSAPPPAPCTSGSCAPSTPPPRTSSSGWTS